MPINKIKLVILSLILQLAYLNNAHSQVGWRYLPNVGLDTPYVRFEDVYFTDTSNGYAVYINYFTMTDSSQKPIYKTRDGGNSWTKVGPAIYGSNALRCIEFLGDKVTGVVGSLSGSIYRTTDTGNTWTDISAAIDDTVSTDDFYVGSKHICGWAHAGNTFYGVGWWGATVARLYKSTDKGVTWTTKYLDTSLATGLVDAVFISADTGFVTGGHNVSAGFFVSPSDESVILKTTDGGNTWTKVFSDTTLGGRIWKIQMLDRMNFVASIEAYYYPDSVNMIKSVDGGNTWTIIHAGSTTDSAIAWDCITQGIGFATPRIGWLGGYYKGLFQTTDGGATWDTVHFGTTFNRFFVIDSTHVFAGGGMVYKWAGHLSKVDVKDVSRPLKPAHILYPVSPNPARGMVKIEFDILTETNVVLQVVNIDARQHTTVTRGRFKPGHYSYYWDSDNMPGGHYMIWLNNDQIPISRRFVLEK